jgi:steroid 5-alpha reductase family enzyme
MDSYNWSHWLGEHWLRWPWAIAIILCMAIYASASVCFGNRWSNLTYRGLMASGVYRLSKHPAYFFKNLSWWLIGIPFIMEAGTDAIGVAKQCLFFVGVNYLYYMRAVTEEAHLSRYPEYREYALWMNDHGGLRFLNRLFPFLRYAPEKYGY